MSRASHSNTGIVQTASEMRILGCAKSRRIALGLLLTCAGLLVSLYQAQEWFRLHQPQMLAALRGTSLAALATAFGAVPVLMLRRIPPLAFAYMRTFGTGVMLSAAACSLLIPSLTLAVKSGIDPWLGSMVFAATVGFGASAVGILATLARSHELDGTTHQTGVLVADSAWALTISILLHNVLEGFAMGLSYAGGSSAQGDGLAVSIALQDVPEGLFVAFALRGAGYGRVFSAGVGMASGLVEVALAMLGSLFVKSDLLLMFGLGGAGGAMLFAAFQCLEFEGVNHRQERWMTLCMVAGFILPLVLMKQFGL